MLTQSFWQKTLVALGFIFVSTLLTVSNTVLLRNARLLPAEILILTQQLFVLLTFSAANYFGFVTLLPFKWPSHAFVFVIGSFALYVFFSMYSQSALQLSLYTALRKMQIMATITLEYIVFRKSYTQLTIVSICILLAGSALIAKDEISGNIRGCAYATLCNIFGAAYIISIAHHKVMCAQVDHMSMVFHCSAYLTLFALVLVLLNTNVEEYYGKLFDWRVLLSVTLAGIMNALVIWNTRINSPVAQSICSNVKDVCVLLIAQTFSGVSLTFEKTLGILLAFSGAALYCFQGELTRISLCKCAGTKMYVNLNTMLVLLMIGIVVRSASIQDFSTFNISRRAQEFSTREGMFSVSNTSMLAVVTTSLSFANGISDSSLIQLSLIGKNFVTLCEMGFRTSVVFSAYDEIDAKWEAYFLDNFGHCHRDLTAFTFKVETFAFEALPANAFGTSGTLAFQHRIIFARQSQNYDFFICQEDDVDYAVANILYFISNYHFMVRMQPALFPSFFDFEEASGTRYASYRMNAGFIFEAESELYFSPIHEPGGRGYIVPRDMLLNWMDTHGLGDFFDSSMVRGEFNPQVASSTVLMKFGRLVHPLRDWQRGGIHHMPNKYIKLESSLNHADAFSGIKFEELNAAFASCHSTSQRSVRTAIKLQGNCAQCLRKKRAVYMMLSVNGSPFIKRKVIAKFSCVDKKKVRFPGYTEPTEWS